MSIGNADKSQLKSLLAALFVVTVASVSGPAHAADPQTDFAARCGAPGVLVCEGFDNASTFVYSSSQDDGLYPPWGSSTVKGIQDTNIKASGTSSLRFDIPGKSGDDAAGNFSKNFGAKFSQNSTFYVQFRQRFDSNMLTIDWYSLMGTFWKQAVIYDKDGVPCANIELATINLYASGIPTMYSECGARHLRGSLSNPLSFTTGVPSYYYQQGASLTSGYNCLYEGEFIGIGDGKGCFYYPANKWITFYYKVHVGTWGSGNSSIEAWISVDGGPYRQWINVRNYTLYHDGNSSGGFSRIMLTPYMTAKNSSVNHATAQTWYDELIVSTQPIAAPGGAPLPSPANLRVVP